MVGGSYCSCHLLGEFSVLQPSDTASHSEKPSLEVTPPDTASHSEKPSLEVTPPEQLHIPADVMTGHLAQAVSLIARYGEMNCTFIL